MKTIKKISALIILLAGILLNLSKVSAQCTAIGVPCGGYDLLTSGSLTLGIMGGGLTCGSALQLNFLGINTTTPHYETDILAINGVGDGVNISDGSANAVGYSIGGGGVGVSNMFLWHSGDVTSVYCGIQAGFATPNVASSGAYENTVLGNGADEAFNGTGGTQNCAFGYWSLHDNTSGTKNLSIGTQSLQVNTIGGANVAVGHSAEYENITGSDNVGVGHDALYTNRSSAFNVAVGERALFNDTAESNTATGYNSGSNIFSGVYNTADGFDALKGITGCTGGLNDASGAYSLNQLYSGNFNASEGAYSLYNDSTGSNNSALGYHSGYTLKIDNNDLFLGNGADELGSGINSASAIGSGAITTASNYMVLGNNNVRATIGLSGRPVANPTRLEINTQFGAFPFNVTATSAPPPYVNGGVGKGWSGLRFDDLTTHSGATRNPGPGVLGLDSLGNVIYVLDTLTSPAANIGTCASPNTLTAANGAIDMANVANFYFLGNSAGDTVNNVAIGLPNTCAIPPAKLTVLQESGDTNTIGILVINKDLASSSLGTKEPNIGIKSFLPVPPACANWYNVAGWFEADYDSLPCSQTPQYAIFVPHNGGTVAVGFKFNTHFNNPNLLIDCSSRARFATWTSPSDSILKTNIKPFNSGLKVVRGLNMVSYKYNGLAGFDTSGKFYGVLAQNVQAVAPYAVISTLEQLDSTSSTPTPILNIDQGAIIYTAINAIKQLDSSVTVHQNTDSVKLLQQQKTIDSLKNVLTSIQNCLSTLCFTGDAPVRGRGGNSNSGDSNSTITNTLDVTLSASTNAPLLYQNIPNPFSTGTKINYYLPQGSIGATIVFYDTYGNQIKTVQLSQTGNGTLNITPDNLTGGIYSYSLVVNNNIIDTKRMILQK